MSFTNILRVDYGLNKADLISKICTCLNDLHTFENDNEDEMEDEKKGKEVIDNLKTPITL